ncbi:DUF3084 domain-containing protein [Leptolyngbya sp. PCC 6406]|uniref:DUF3084 domain-containing protein n=1 Tax=Leptolyngbya sp. PCC 6406 TaxID=1173264 RepID=UPI0002AC33E5|nr:DUF3084 domain-containing protein [Leptolyngbya sp. PCC 6406]
MTTGFVLIFAVLVLGGAIATLGDRIGMKVGKARLSLFNLRPRQTATVVSVLTGTLISASTLGLLFAVSRQLRTGVFQLERIQADLVQAEASLVTAQDQRTQIEAELSDSRRQQSQAQRRLRDINESLQGAVARQQETEEELLNTQEQLEQRQQLLEQSKDQLIQTRRQLDIVSRQSSILQGEISRLQTDRDTQIAQRDREIAERQQRLGQLQEQQNLLEADVARLERQFTGLFRGNVAVSRNEALVFGLVRVGNVREAQEAVNQLLLDANLKALQEIAPGTDINRQVLLISREEVERLVLRISDRQEYVVRLLSAANYIIGEPCVVAADEPCVQVFVDVSVNRLIYTPGERLAAVNADVPNLTNQGLVEQINLLVASLQFRARQEGVVADTLQIADGRGETLRDFIQVLRAINQPVEIWAIAANPIYTAGPFRVELVAVREGRILAQTLMTPVPGSGQPLPRDNR